MTIRRSYGLKGLMATYLVVNTLKEWKMNQEVMKDSNTHENMKTRIKKLSRILTEKEDKRVRSIQVIKRRKEVLAVVGKKNCGGGELEKSNNYREMEFSKMRGKQTWRWFCSSTKP